MPRLSCLALALVALLSVPVDAQTKPVRTLAPGQVARVSSRIITADDLLERMADVESGLNVRERRMAAALDSLLREQLLELEAQRLGAMALPNEIKLYVDKRIEEEKQRQKQKHGGAVKWEDWLKSMNLNEDDLRRNWARGYRQLILTRLLVNQFEDVNDSLDVAVIVMKDRDAAEAVLGELRAGRDFGDMVAQKSLPRAPGSATKGLLPRHYRGHGLWPEAQERVWTLKDGELALVECKVVNPRQGEPDVVQVVLKRVKTHKGVPVDAIAQREALMKRADPDESRFMRWAACVVAERGYQLVRRNFERKGGRVVQPPELKPNEAGRVGPRVVTSEDLIARLWEIELTIYHEFRIVATSLDYLVHIQLLELEAERIGCTIKEREIDAEVDTWLKAAKERLRIETRGAVSWEDHLKTLGLDEASMREYARPRMRLTLLKHLVIGYFEATNDAYEVSHILSTTKLKSEDLLRRLSRGEKFEDLARKESQDPGSGPNGGNLGWRYKGDGIATELEKVYLALEDGKYHDKPVQTDFGWHIVKRVRTRPGNKHEFIVLKADLMDPKITPRDSESVMDNRLKRWINCITSRSPYVFERRLPGLDCRPNEVLK